MIFRNLPEWPHGVYYLLSLTLSPLTPALAEDVAQHKNTHLRRVLSFCLSHTQQTHTFLSGDAVTQICCISNKDAEFSNNLLVSSERTDVGPSICLLSGLTNFVMFYYALKLRQKLVFNKCIQGHVQYCLLFTVYMSDFHVLKIQIRAATNPKLIYLQ